MKIYTKTGDKGETSLIDGTRVKKTNKRISAYGCIDEANSHIGMLISLLKLKNDEKFNEYLSTLLQIQNNLFILGSDLANPNQEISSYPRITDEHIKFIENTIDTWDTRLPKLTVFILPGGSIESSKCHIIRTVIRRSEILVTDLLLNKEISDECFIYVNRLSDLFFVLARILNRIQNIEDITWKYKE